LALSINEYVLKANSDTYPTIPIVNADRDSSTFGTVKSTEDVVEDLRSGKAEHRNVLDKMENYSVEVASVLSQANAEIALLHAQLKQSELEMKKKYDIVMKSAEAPSRTVEAILPASTRVTRGTSEEAKKMLAEYERDIEVANQVTKARIDV
jgi:hypothetical protein